MAGCRNQGNACEESDHCTRRRPQAVAPSAGVPVEYSEYPITQFRTGNYNIPNRTADAVMHDSIFVPYVQGEDGQPSGPADAATGGNCGKIRYTGCSGGFLGGDYVYDWYPTELSFDWQSSDTWIAYLYDTGNSGGVAGVPVYYLETCTTTSTSTTQGTPNVPASSTSSTTSTTTCKLCTAHTCSPATTDLKYTYNGQDLTQDPDCPFPDLFGIGTESNKIVFSYDSLSTTLSDGVTDFAFSFSGATYINVYDAALGLGAEYNSAQNPWQVGDENFNTFEIFDSDVFDSEVKSGFRIKVRIEPVIDETGGTAVFTGTKWTVLELMSPGQGYEVGDVYTLNYTHVHPDLTESVLTVDIKITTIGPVQITTGQDGFDVMRTSDTINGHTILRVYHTDIDNFPYHVAYVDGNGNDFTKDTQYTSSRNHVITAKAGYGIVDRACLVGRYEFTEKSIQYVTASFDKNSPDVFNSIRLPDATAIITNGKVTGFTIDNPGKNLTSSFLNGQDPILTIGPPTNENGQPAVVEGNFIGGQLSSIKIVNGGTLYDANDPPKLYIANTYKEVTTRYSNDSYEPDKLERYSGYFDAYPGPEDPNARGDFNESADTIPQEISFRTKQENIDIKFDKRRKKADVLPQSLYSQDKTAPLYPILIRDTDLRYLDRLDHTDLVSGIRGEEADRKTRISTLIDGITQYQVPEYNVTQEVLVETVQGRVGDLPYGTEFTKYILKQYRADPSERTTISVTLSCNPVAPGVNTTVCPPPAPPIVPPTSVTDPTTGATNSASTTCIVTGPHGPGCLAWEVSGEMLFLHDLTRSAATVVSASKAFGNPLLQT
ncbi:hypothetical protein Syn7803C76_82 [Synechococcus phage ACG-2014b]|uniref:Baseplate wedge initiator n=2 Tax=Synechococcus phage ACG-2014b TaxID=1493508 RepID=A0A0E3EZE8_9CAUD|nr:baseplate wedge subunit [Synechococcus phage ACG-2014b]YP_009779710.1 baseplate wedge subunit [Synechococcus phage ACG-2014b]AIX17304.1 hypothetical protein Syn7803C61_82 [Synechococcus phage ACG-2014b]AIX17949.1 hypothetical protein Syn7803C68_81 [Synechococcus phage ACG-2014b]AIX18164.1 hypothetical protein Syn7803C69_80 [Synechococcus phage ACG-2014b]AIX19322.1 hypothetical protein Syn7803C76_82 [Synechococcus phage ACG-2014b]AIX19756.1 hypothetical protein Syn7803C78_81 [Synechococcus 